MRLDWKFLKMPIRRFRTMLTSQNKQYGVGSGRTVLIPSASGGSISEAGGYRIHSFSSDDNFVVNAGISQIEFLLVGAGGAGYQHGNTSFPLGPGGGGAGACLYVTSQSVINESYSVSIGQGVVGGNGESSVAFSYTAPGGGRGDSNSSGQAGGSGGGGGNNSSNGAGGVSTKPSNGVSSSYYGNSGGAGYWSGGWAGNNKGGGGGGAGGAGAAGTSGNGGPGTSFSISGFSVTYAGGGGGCSKNSGSSGGSGGGGAGTTSTGINGTNGLGGGGGGGFFTYSRGGSGILILRYLSLSSYSYD